MRTSLGAPELGAALSITGSLRLALSAHRTTRLRHPSIAARERCLYTLSSPVRALPALSIAATSSPALPQHAPAEEGKRESHRTSDAPRVAKHLRLLELERRLRRGFETR
jgi:hypothetical protein